MTDTYDDSVNVQTNVEQRINLEALQKMRGLFLRADVDGSGGLDLDEFIREFSEIFELDDPLELRRLFMKIDADSNGQVDWDEFCNFVFLDKDVDDESGPDQKWMLYTETKFIKGLVGGHVGGQEKRVNKVENSDRVIAPDAELQEELESRPEALYLHQTEEHTDAVNAICLWPARDRVYTGGQDGRVKVWEGKTMLLLETIRFPENMVVYALAMMPLSRKLFVGLSDRTISIFHTSRTSTTLVGRLTQLPSIATCMLVPPSVTEDEEMVFWGNTEGHVDFYCPSSKTLFRQTDASGRPEILVIPKKDLSHALIEGWNNFHTYHEGSEITQMSWDPSSTSIVTSDRKSRLEYVELNMYRRRVFDKPIRFHRGGITTFDFSREYCHLFSGGLERDVHVSNMVTGAIVGRLTGPSASIRKIVVVEECDQIMALDNRKTITIWDTRTRLIIQSVDHSTVNFYPEDRIVTMIYDRINRRLLACSNELLVYQNEVEFIGERSHEAPIVKVLFAETFSLLISADERGYVISWDVSTGMKKFRFKVKHTPITSMALDYNERRVVIGTGNGHIDLWNFNNGSHLRSCHYPGAKTEITGVAHMRFKNVNLIMACGWNGDIMLWSDELEKGRSASELHNCRVVKAHPVDIQYMTYTGERNPDESSGVVMTGDHDGSILAWSAIQGSTINSIKPLEHIPKAERSVTGIILAPIGGVHQSAQSNKSVSNSNNYVVISTLDGFVRVWTYLLAGGTCFAEVRAVPVGFNGKMLEAKGSVTSMSSNRALSVLATGDNRGWVRVWDTSTLLEHSNNFKDPVSGGQVRVTQEIMDSTAKCFKHVRWIMASIYPITSLKVLEENDLMVVGSAGSLHQLTLWTLQGANIGTFGYRGDHGEWNLSVMSTWRDRSGPKPELAPYEQYNVRNSDCTRIGSPGKASRTPNSRASPDPEGLKKAIAAGRLSKDDEAGELTLVSESESEDEQEMTLEEVEVAALLQANRPNANTDEDDVWLAEAITTNKVNAYRMKQFTSVIAKSQEQERDEMVGKRIGMSTLVKKRYGPTSTVDNLGVKPVVNGLGLLNRDLIRTASRAIGVVDSYHVDQFVAEGKRRTREVVREMEMKSAREREIEAKKAGGL